VLVLHHPPVDPISYSGSVIKGPLEKALVFS
jgi:hypothetical protein